MYWTCFFINCLTQLFSCFSVCILFHPFFRWQKFHNSHFYSENRKIMQSFLFVIESLGNFNFTLLVCNTTVVTPCIFLLRQVFLLQDELQENSSLLISQYTGPDCNFRTRWFNAPLGSPGSSWPQLSWPGVSGCPDGDECWVVLASRQGAEQSLNQIFLL